jgi:16S rRNA processing protein RimM
MSSGARRFRKDRATRRGEMNHGSHGWHGSAPAKPAQNPEASRAGSRREAQPEPGPAASVPSRPSTGRGRSLRGEEVWPPAELIALGRILRPHGLRGEVRVYPYTRSADELVARCPGDVVLWHPDGRTEAQVVEGLDMHQGIVLIAFEAVRDRTAAEGLRGAFLCIREGERWELQKDEYYIDALAGLEVVDAYTGAAVGRVTRVIEGAAHDYLETAVPGRKEPALVPFVREFVVRIDVAGRRIEVRLPEGLMEPEE